MEDKQKTRISKFLSLILRHKPEEGNIVLDDNGWTDVRTLLTKLGNKGYKLSMADLEDVVATNEKKRFAFNENKTKIRASQGHSVEVDLKLQEQEPPEILYHGTVNQFLSAIKLNGLLKMTRQHVHLSDNIDTATNVGSRRGSAIILEVRALEMHEDGFKFYKSANNVWLTDKVPYDYIDFN